MLGIATDGFWPSIANAGPVQNGGHPLMPSPPEIDEDVPETVVTESPVPETSVIVTCE